VVAACAEGFLVRGLYSLESPTRHLFQPWRRAHLDHVSYIDDIRIVVAADAELTKLVQLSDEEWNSLF
jgi:hypothetical protein